MPEGGRPIRFRATELAVVDKPSVLRAYLRRWKFEVGAFFDGVGPHASAAELLRMAPGYPAFAISPVFVNSRFLRTVERPSSASEQW